MRRLIGLGAMAVILAGLCSSAGHAQTTGVRLTIYALDLQQSYIVTGEHYEPYYLPAMCSEGPYDAAGAKTRAQWILDHGVRCGSVWYPAHRVQKVVVYDPEYPSKPRP